MLNIVDRLIGIKYIYGTGAAKTAILETELYFADGQTAHISGHWAFMLGVTYNITCSGDHNPYTLDTITIHAG